MNHKMMQEAYIADLEAQIKKLNAEVKALTQTTDWLRNEMILAAELLANTEYDIDTNWEARNLMRDTYKALEKTKKLTLALKWYQEHAQATNRNQYNPQALLATLKLDNGSRASQALENSRPRNKSPHS